MGVGFFGVAGAVAGINEKNVITYKCADCGQTLSYCMNDYEKQQVESALQSRDNFYALDRLTEIKKKYPKPVIDMLREAVRLYKVLKRRADKRGCFELESGEAVIRLDESGYPCGIERIDRGVCERLIEQFMLCANEAVARLICARSIPGIYRIHEKPDPEKCAVLLQYAENLGLDIKKMKLGLKTL